VSTTEKSNHLWILSLTASRLVLLCKAFRMLGAHIGALSMSAASCTVRDELKLLPVLDRGERDTLLFTLARLTGIKSQ